MAAGPKEEKRLVAGSWMGIFEKMGGRVDTSTVSGPFDF